MKESHALSAFREMRGRGAHGREYFVALWKGIVRDYKEFGTCEYINALLRGEIADITWVELAVLRGLSSGEDVDLNRPYIPGAVMEKRGGFGYVRMPVAWEEGAAAFGVEERDLYLAAGIRKQLERPGASEKKPEAPKPAAPKEGQPAAEEAEKILSAARQEAEEILAAARKEAEKRVSEAEAQAKAQAQARAEALCAQYLADYRRNLRGEMEREAAAENLRDTAAAQEQAAARRQMSAELDALRVSWRTDLERVVAEMRGLQGELEGGLRAWQRALYPREMLPLADVYVQLYRIVNRDELFASALSSAPTEETARGLQELAVALSALLARLGRAMGKLGLHLYIPAPGEPYDDVLQAAPGGEIPGAVVAECLVPGVVCAPDGDLEEGNPLIRALVRLQKGAGEEA